MKLEFILCALLLGFSSASFSQTDLEIVIASGFGADLDSAITNTAENALMDVVGTLVESQELVEKRTEIRDGVRNRIKNISSRNSTYSQGSIRAINILSSEQDSNGLYRVQASVTVEISDFKAYLTESVLAKKDVNVGLFARAQISQEQNSGLTEILKRILDELFSLEVYTLDVYGEIDLIDDADQLQKLKRSDATATWVSVPISVTLNGDFYANILSTLDELSQDKYQGLPGKFSRDNVYTDFTKEGPFFFISDFLTSNEANQFEYTQLTQLTQPGLFLPAINDSEMFTSYKLPEISRTEICSLFRSRFISGYDDFLAFYPTFTYSVLDATGSAIKEGYVSTPIDRYQISGPGLATIENADKNFYLFRIQSKNGASCNLAVDKFLDFELLMPMSNDELSRASSFEIKLSTAYE